MTQPNSIADVVQNGLCIGCGLCQALAPDRWRMEMTAQGRLRPTPLASGDDSEILSACPGVQVSAPTELAPQEDRMWGKYHGMTRAWSGDPDVRFRAATGGVLTALGMHLISSGTARFILHCKADADGPMRSRWTISETPAQVAAACGSRYGPTDTLAGLEVALARNEPFALIAKPCDASALRSRAKADPRIDRLVVAVLVMVCGGASDLGKSWLLLDELGLGEDDLSLFRYRGHGNPGCTRIETKDGRAFERSYNDMWADEAGWRIQSRCKVCPDPNGEAADIAAADIWPGGSPVGDDEGFNGVITRTAHGEALMRNAVSTGALGEDETLTPSDFDDFQPHQVTKKVNLAARLRGMAQAGMPVLGHSNLRIDALDVADPAQEKGAFDRALSGRFSEPFPEKEI